MSWVSANRLSIVAKDTWDDIRIVSRDRKGLNRDGVETTDVEKRLYTDTISESLASESLVYADPSWFISDKPAQCQLAFEEQLHLFRRTVIPSTDENVRNKPKVCYSGHGKDDYVLACGITMFHSRLTIETLEYQKEAEQQGWYAQ